jgi:hypothetical protein
VLDDLQAFVDLAAQLVAGESSGSGSQIATSS